MFVSQVDANFHFLDISLLDSPNQKKVCLLKWIFVCSSWV